ncbi:hypothetical protein FSP39_003529 [Pinctada imbricata]|uniref:F-box domain-containing protein n=1 Tax=Pinctada imbricata TaxID=66713 RepID=A0AA89C6I4_PINIB|nr:hypothetical protein FSP39_003529 [Pinctada imbricata]
MDSDEEDSLWQNLTDPLLLDIFSNLNARSLLNAAQTCKNWYRLANHNMLWKYVLCNRLKKDVTLRNEDLTWQEEYKRVTYHVPIELMETCKGHNDEIYHITFSQSGRYFSTVGREGKVFLWRFCHPIELIKSSRPVGAGYTRYSEFNQSETLLLVGGLRGSFMHEGYICILTVPDLRVLYAVKGEYTNFRGTWLNDRTFLNASHFFDDRIYFKLDAHTVPSDSNYCDSDVEDMFDRCYALGKQVLKVFPCNPRNDFVKVVDPQKWHCFEPKTSNESSSSQEHESDCERNKMEATAESCVSSSNSKKNVGHEHSDSDSEITEEDDGISLERFDGWRSKFSLDNEELGKIVVLCHNSRLSSRESCLAFYYINSETINEVTQPYKTLDLKAGIHGLRVTPDDRYVVYNRRLLIDNDQEFFGGHYQRSIQVVLYDMYMETHLQTVYEGSMAESVDRISYIFPDICDLYIANGSESNFVHLWDRHYEVSLAKLVHDTADHVPTHSGVNAVVFYPYDCEVLLTVADDHSIKVWMSRNRKSYISHSEDMKRKNKEDQNGEMSHVKSDSLDTDDEHHSRTHTCCFCSRVKKRR